MHKVTKKMVRDEADFYIYKKIYSWYMSSYLSHNYISISILTDPTENDGSKGKCFFFRKKIKSEVKFKHKRMYFCDLI